MKAALIIMTMLSQSQADARMRMIASRPSVSPDALVVYLLASMRADHRSQRST